MNPDTLGMENQMERKEAVMQLLGQEIGAHERMKPISFDQFLDLVISHPSRMIRNIFQVFHDMMTAHVTIRTPEEDSEKVGIPDYDCSRLFVDGSDAPYFTDRLFAHRLMQDMERMRHGTQQNQIYIFHGPHGCGKSTFLNNLLKKFELFANSPEGMRYEIVWRLDVRRLGLGRPDDRVSAIERLVDLIDSRSDGREEKNTQRMKGGGPGPSNTVSVAGIEADVRSDFIEIPCISHDNPLLIIPKTHRRQFLDRLIPNDEFKWRLFTEKEYEWVFSHEPCTICESIYQALLERVGEPRKVFDMVHARPYHFNRRLGTGISVFNPGDAPLKHQVMTNPMLQNRINHLFRDSNLIHYLYSRFAKTNNGIYALMDIKSHNVERMVELHNVISEAVHKVEDTEESVNSLFMALMNPEDKKNIRDFPSFTDRIRYINIPYVLDIETEMKIYSNIFGRHVEEAFLPMVMANFARVIISSRLKSKADELSQWIGDPSKYRLYCDEQLMLLKMEIYSGRLPDWLDDDDLKALDDRRRRKIIKASETEGNYGFSGRDAIRLFDRFYSASFRADRLISMPELCTFFEGIRKEYPKMIPEGFLESLLRMYDYTVLQQVKESLYDYNEAQIAKDIRHYVSALTFEKDAQGRCLFTGEPLHATEPFLEAVESRLYAEKPDQQGLDQRRQHVLNQYASHTLPREIMIDGTPFEQTRLFLSLKERYVYNLKKKVLEPFWTNENFRRAVKDYSTTDFKSYDRRIQEDIRFLIRNMAEKFGYTEKGATAVCLYVMDADPAEKFKS